VLSCLSIVQSARLCLALPGACRRQRERGRGVKLHGNCGTTLQRNRVLLSPRPAAHREDSDSAFTRCHCYRRFTPCVQLT
jgi:hypothetical protein